MRQGFYGKERRRQTQNRQSNGGRAVCAASSRNGASAKFRVAFKKSALCREKRVVFRKKTEDELGTRGASRFFPADSAKKEIPFFVSPPKKAGKNEGRKKKTRKSCFRRIKNELFKTEKTIGLSKTFFQGQAGVFPVAYHDLCSREGNAHGDLGGQAARQKRHAQPHQAPASGSFPLL